MGKLPKKLKLKLSERAVNNALRSLPAAMDLVDFSSNDYLGISKETAIHDQALQILEDRNLLDLGATGSRLLTGNHGLYEELELFLSGHHLAQSALVFNSGYDANVGFFSSVPQRDDIIFYDELVHASIRDGIKMGLAKSYKFKHNDLEQLKEKITALLQGGLQQNTSEIYIVTESVFSMDGDSPDFKALVKICRDHNCYLVVDEAHATGIYGNGRDLISELELQDEVFARIITFGKAMGSHGAAILGSEELKRYLVNFARSLIYSTAMSPHTVAVILAAYHFLDSEGAEPIGLLQQNIQYFKDEIHLRGLEGDFIESHTAIHCLVVSGNQKIKSLAQHLQQSGFDVKPILSPTVKTGEERLRFCLHSYNTKEEISRVLQLVKSALD